MSVLMQELIREYLAPTTNIFIAIYVMYLSLSKRPWPVLPVYQRVVQTFPTTPFSYNMFEMEIQWLFQDLFRDYCG